MGKRKVDPWAEPSVWEARMEQYRNFNDRGIKDLIRFGNWFSGNMEDLRTELAAFTGPDNVGPLSNHININTIAGMADLMVRSPRYYSIPQTRYGPPFTPALAEMEVTLLNDDIEETDFFNEARACILDGLVGPMMVFKVGYSKEMDLDHEMMTMERDHARVENETMLAGGRPTVKSDDYHPGHIEEHDRIIAAVERGELEVTAATLRYMKKHRKFHEDACTKDGSRPLETVRQESVFGERVSPLCFGCDPVGTNPARRRWVGEWFPRPVDEVRADLRFDAAARMQVEAADLTSLGGEAMQKALRLSGEDEIDDMALLFQGFDLQHGKRVMFAQGAEKALFSEDYHEIRIRPAGPYITASFMRDPIRDCGVAPPRIYEAHQKMVSYMDALSAIAARRSVPMIGMVGDLISPDVKQAIENGVPAALIALAGLPPGTKLADVFQRIPTPDPTRVMLEVRALHERGAERYSGIGSARSFGGDDSKTATASAIVQDASTGLAEDRRAVWDNFATRIGRDKLRLIRRNYSRAKVAEIVGPRALDEVDGWPERWSERDICRDRGLTIVPGSSRRRDAAVELKLNTELFAIAAKVPGIPPQIVMDMFKRVLDSAGMYAIDTGSLDMAAQMAQIEALLGRAGGGAPGEGPPGGGPPQGGGGPKMPTGSNGNGRTNPERRGAERGEGTQAAIQQGTRSMGVPRG